MNEFKPTELLAKLFEEAEKISGGKKATLTVERYVAAAIQMALQNGDADPEMKWVRSVLAFQQVRLEMLLQKLLHYIATNTERATKDGLYFQTKKAEAMKSAMDHGMTEVSADRLLSCIFAAPNTALQVMIAESSTKATPPGIENVAVTVPTVVPVAEKCDEKSTKEKIADLVEEVKRIRTELKSNVFGQDNAINTFASGYFQACMSATLDVRKNRPRATFLFAGPPGVGKTFLAENIAASLKLPFKRFDMSEYADKEANLEFCGSDKVYKNGKAGNVTSFVAENPTCVLLFDEIEKAHATVIHLFLQMLDAGRLRDNFTDEEVDFTNAVIILTTNAGKQLYEDSESGDFSTVSRKVIINALQKDVNPETHVPFFPGAICSRFASGNVVMFNHIGAHNLRAIAKKEIDKNATVFSKESGIDLQIDERVYTALLFSEGSRADARTIRSRAETFYNDELYELLRLISSDKVTTGIDAVETLHMDVDLTNTDAEIVKKFQSAQKTKVLVFADEQTVAQCKATTPSCEFFGVQERDAAIRTIKEQDIDFIVMDVTCGAVDNIAGTLNIEDVVSPARDFFKFLREQNSSIPVYLLEPCATTLSEEEKISFTQQGVRDVLPRVEHADEFSARLVSISAQLYQQASMIALAKENKLISFDTAQYLSEDGKKAEIKLFDFKMAVAVDAEDAKNVLSAVSRPNVRFDEVIGAGDAKKELTYFVEYLRNPKKYMGTGVKAPKGILLYGPPGTGKTMLAKAMACEAGVTFIAAEGNQFTGGYVGEGSRKVHELFRTARKYAPSILFVDEIDAIAKERTGSGSGEDTLTAFLTEMDGFISDPSKPVFVLAATNFEVEPGSRKSLDPALMRRFDRRIYIALPNREDRIRFLNLKIAGNPALTVSTEKVESIAMRSTGMSLAQVDSVVELALRSAIREGSTVVTDAIFDDAFELFSHGEEKPWSAALLERTARHEAGHAFLYWLSGTTPSYLTIVARGGHGGYMRQAEKQNKEMFTREEMLGLIRTALGGRAAEIVYYGDKDGISTGASGDLMSATHRAQLMLCAYGMDEDFGLAVVGEEAADSAEVRARVNQILKEPMAEAIRLIRENKDKLDALVAELLVKNHMSGAEIEAVLGKKTDH